MKNKMNDDPDKEKLKNVFGKEYEDLSNLINGTENKLKIFMNELNKELEEKYKIFNQDIKSYLLKKANAFNEFKETEKGKNSKNSKNIQENYLNEIKGVIHSIQELINTQNIILESASDTLSLLQKSMSLTNNLEVTNLVSNFLYNERDKIKNSGLYIKLGLDKLNINKSDDNNIVDINIFKMAIQLKEGKNLSYTIGPKNLDISETGTPKIEEINDKDISFIQNKSETLTKLKINNVIFLEQNSRDLEDLEKLSTLKMNNIWFLKEMNTERFLTNLNGLTKLFLNALHDFSFRGIKFFPENLTHLILSNNNLINSEFERIFEIIKNRKKLRETLKYLSFSNNKITKISLDVQDIKYKFYLEEIDLHKNKLNQFIINKDNFSSLQVINLSYNKFSRYIKPFEDNILKLTCGNLNLTNERYSREYFSDLKKVLKTKKIPLTQLTLSFLPKSMSNEELSMLEINKGILINIKKIDLSYNNMTCDTIFKFLKKNDSCIFLNKLNLSGNQIDETFFDIFVKEKLNTKFTKLRKINLRGNLIGSIEQFVPKSFSDNSNRKDNIYIINKLRVIYNFIKCNENLKKLNITKNPLSSKFTISTDIDLENIELLIEKDQKKQIIITGFYSFLLKINREILNKEEAHIRSNFVIKFDIGNQINLDSDTFKYNREFIMINKNS